MQIQNEKSTDKNWTTTTPAMQSCIQNCFECFQICSQTLSYCLENGGQFLEPKRLKLLWDCAGICDLSAKFMIRNSENHSLTCKVCAEICTACAASCEAMPGDEMMKKCVDICRKCAKSCEEMASLH